MFEACFQKQGKATYFHYLHCSHYYHQAELPLQAAAEVISHTVLVENRPFRQDFCQKGQRYVSQRQSSGLRGSFGHEKQAAVAKSLKHVDTARITMATTKEYFVTSVDKDLSTGYFATEKPQA